MLRIVAIDLETSGLNPETCQILEIAVVVDDLDNPQPIDSLPTFQTLIKHEIYSGTPFAIQLNVEIFKKLADKNYPAMTCKEAATELHKFFDKLFKGDKINVAGKNVGTFDYRFFMQDPHLRRVADRFFRHRMIDVGALFLKPEDDSIPGMEECMRRGGLNPIVTHHALDDAKDVIKLIRIWAERQKQVIPRLDNVPIVLPVYGLN